MVLADGCQPKQSDVRVVTIRCVRLDLGHIETGSRLNIKALLNVSIYTGVRRGGEALSWHLKTHLRWIIVGRFVMRLCARFSQW